MGKAQFHMHDSKGQVYVVTPVDAVSSGLIEPPVGFFRRWGRRALKLIQVLAYVSLALVTFVFFIVFKRK